MSFNLSVFKNLNNRAYFILGGLDSAEPWQGRWASGVLVECVGRPENAKIPSNRNRQPQPTTADTGQTKY